MINALHGGGSGCLRCAGLVGRDVIVGALAEACSRQEVLEVLNGRVQGLLMLMLVSAGPWWTFAARGLREVGEPSNGWKL